MNELEKMPLPEEPTSAQPSACEETPAAPAAEATEACAEESSPALDIAEAADEVSEPADDKSDEPKPQDFHNLTKDELVGKLKEILDTDNMQAHKEVKQLNQAFFNIRKHEVDEEMAKFVDQGNLIETFSATPDPKEEVFQEFMSQFKTRRAAFLQKEEDRRQENLALKLKAIEGIKALMEDVDNINRNYNDFQRLQQEFKDVKDIPAQAETEIWKQYQTVVEQFYDLLKLNKELRDLDFRKNLEAKREIIEQAKALGDLTDPVVAFRKLQDLHNAWREIGPVAKDIRESLWEEFKTASAVINRRHQEYFEQRKAEEVKNEELKTKLCEEVEAIDFANVDSFNQWERLTEEIKTLQNRWKEVGFAPRKTNNELYARFRKSIDAFFSKKAEYYKEMRETFRQNLEKKMALVGKAEALAADENASKSIDQVMALQEEWKTIGSVERKQSDIVWRRFRKACNEVFERQRKKREDRNSEESANLAAKKDVITRLTALLEATEENPDAIKQMSLLQQEWRGIGHVPFSEKKSISNEYREVVDKLSDKLGVGRRAEGARRVRERMGDRQDGRNTLADRIRARKADLVTYENNLGFFNVKSKAGNSMVQQLERKIENLKSEIAEMEAQLRAEKEAPKAE